jgi:hypothetical protein
MRLMTVPLVALFLFACSGENAEDAPNATDGEESGLGAGKILCRAWDGTTNQPVIEHLTVDQRSECSLTALAATRWDTYCTTNYCANRHLSASRTASFHAAEGENENECVVTHYCQK